MPTNADLWKRYQEYLCLPDGIDFRMDVSRMNFPSGFFDEMAGPIGKAFDAMAELEGGAIANPDENRQVGHYWLRNPDIAPAERAAEVRSTLEAVKKTAAAVHAGEIAPAGGGKFRHALIIGIGGSALGPQLVYDALRTPDDPMGLFFFDNTDPDGMEATLAQIGDDLAETLSIVISKSGGTKETRNGMLEAKAAYERAGLDFAKHAIAVTGEGSALDKVAVDEGWLARLPMFDYIGGRTSELAAVGLLPAALHGADIDGMLAGARDMDIATRVRDARKNPAALMALMWYYATGGRGERDMVVLPYKDRLMLMSKYLQQLVMESIGKELDLDGKVVNQGIAVYGNKGSTDQHAYVQQLREGVNNFFVVFIEVMKDRTGEEIEVEPGATSGDFLSGFFQGTRAALYEKGRESMTISVPDVSARTIGMLIALFERAVGLYASLVNINAYHQPGVEAGKKAAGAVLDVQKKVVAAIRDSAESKTADDWAVAIGQPDAVETVWFILDHLAANGTGIVRTGGRHPGEARFGKG